MQVVFSMAYIAIKKKKSESTYFKIFFDKLNPI